MKQYFRLIVLVGLLLLSLSLTLPLAAQDGANELTYAVFGPYWVGHRELVANEGTEDELEMSIWYPALNPEGGQEQPVPRRGGLRDAEVDRSQCPYALVIFSPGFTANPLHYYSSLSEHLASYGFVVIAPYHRGDVVSILHGSIVRRVVEVRRTISYADHLTTEDAVFAGIIDTETIAVVGHSGGGMTAFGAGGASVDLTSLEAYCSHPLAAGIDPACINLSGNIEAMLEAADLETMPEGLWQPIWDPRVDAIVPLSAAIDHYGQRGLATITVPTLIMYGSLDTIGAPTMEIAEIYLHPAFDYVGSSQKVREVLEGAGHRIAMDYGERDAEVKHFATAFLLATLKEDADAAAALAPEAVVFPGVQYEATGF